MWLLELVEVMIRQHIDIGHTPQEAEQLKKEHEKFGFTAKVKKHTCQLEKPLVFLTSVWA